MTSAWSGTWVLYIPGPCSGGSSQMIRAPHRRAHVVVRDKTRIPIMPGGRSPSRELLAKSGEMLAPFKSVTAELTDRGAFRAAMISESSSFSSISCSIVRSHCSARAARSRQCSTSLAICWVRSSAALSSMESLCAERMARSQSSFASQPPFEFAQRWPVLRRPAEQLYSAPSLWRKFEHLLRCVCLTLIHD